jgi:predicted  nucleic acid-binding Zn-ribbon protein
VKINREIELSEHRCYDCGRYWALESAVSGECPKCASDRIKERYADLDAANRTIAALHGALTKAKRKGTP